MAQLSAAVLRRKNKAHPVEEPRPVSVLVLNWHMTHVFFLLFPVSLLGGNSVW